jgi:hypothetical protein
MAAKLTVVREEAVRREEGDYVVTLPAPGKQVSTEHPFMGPLPKAMNHMMAIRRLMTHEGMSLYEADQAALEASVSHDGKGRKHQPSHLR